MALFQKPQGNEVREDGFETWPKEDKIRLLLEFIEQHGLDLREVLVHGSLSLEIMGFELTAHGFGAHDIDLVCLNDSVFAQLVEYYSLDSNSDAILLIWEGVQFEIFRQWAPAPELAQHQHVVRDRACRVVVPTPKGETCFLIPNIHDVLIYKKLRSDAPLPKQERDRAHLGIMTGPQRELLVALMQAAASSVGLDTREMAIQVALDVQGES